MSSDLQKFGPFQLSRLIHQVLGRNFWALLGWVVVMGFVYTLWLVPPIIIGKIINAIENKATQDAFGSLLFLSGLLAGMLILEALLRMAAKPALAKLSFEASYQAKIIAFRNLLSHTLAWHDQELNGSKIERVTNGGASVSTLLDLLHSSLLGTSITFVSVLATMLFFDWKYSLYGFCYVALFWVIQIYFVKRERALLIASNLATERAAGAYTESTGNIVTIKTLSLEKGVHDHVSHYERIARDSWLQQKRIAFRKYGYFRIFDGVAHSGFIVFAGVDVLNGSLSLGVFTTLIAFFRSLDGAVREAVSFMDSLVQNWIAVGRLAPLILDENNTDASKREFPTDWKTIELHRASSKYANGNKGIKNVTLSIRRGEHIGIVGSSGSGKSTLAKILMGVTPLSEGQYLIDDISFDDISEQSRSRYIAMVLQDSEMFSISLRDNITALRDLPAAMIMTAAKIAKLDSVIEILDKGIDSLIGERGYRLSGGERQRVGIARAVCQNPEILILDEATANLDSITEKQIHSNLLEHLGSKTMIIIAHRLSTLRSVDRIIVMENGEIVETGQPEDLLKQKNSKFKQLWESQEGSYQSHPS